VSKFSLIGLLYPHYCPGLAPQIKKKKKDNWKLKYVDVPFWVIFQRFFDEMERKNQNHLTERLDI
jgi:hypothetical protein